MRSKISPSTLLSSLIPSFGPWTLLTLDLLSFAPFFFFFFFFFPDDLDGKKTVGSSSTKRAPKRSPDLVLRDQNGMEHGPFDLVVLADGTKSHLRPSVEWKKGFSEDPYEWGALWTILEDKQKIMCKNELFQVYDKCHTMFGFLPTGINPSHHSPFAFRDQSSSTGADRVETVSLFWSIKHRDVAKWATSNFEEWLHHLKSLNPRAASLLDQLSDPSQLAVAQYSDVDMKCMAADNIISIGDCAHATSPQLGMGVCSSSSIHSC